MGCTYFRTESGVKEGDTMSSTLFNCFLMEVFGKLEWSIKGLNVNGSLS